MPILLPNECWLDILRFCSRARLGSAVSLCCRRLHALAYPLMHELGARQLWMHVYGEPENPQEFRTWSHRIRMWPCPPPDYIPLDIPPPKNVECVKSLTIDQDVTPGVCAFIAFLARHRLLRKLDVSDMTDNLEVHTGNEVLRDLVTQFPALFEQRPPPFSMLGFAQRWTRPMLSHPAVLGLPALSICVRAAHPERIGPLLNWLHWPAAGAQQQQQRVLLISLGGEGDPQFLNRFQEALQQRFLGAKHRRPFHVLVWIWANVMPRPELEAQPELWNPRSREVLRVVAVSEPDPDAQPDTHVYRIERKPIEQT